jgi:sulfate adenylyltransferase subunit 2
MTNIDLFSHSMKQNRPATGGTPPYWTIDALHSTLGAHGQETSIRTVERAVLSRNQLPTAISLENLHDERDRSPKRWAARSLIGSTRKARRLSLFVQLHTTPSGQSLIVANDARQARRWVFVHSGQPDDAELIAALRTLCAEDIGRIILWPHGTLCGRFRRLVDSAQTIADELRTALAAYNPVFDPADQYNQTPLVKRRSKNLSHLDRLEAESIHIMREVAATANNPAMLYSCGKDSAVMLHLARKAFYPAAPPFPLLHVDTGWKFQEMLQYRDHMAAEARMKLIIHVNPEGISRNINPIDHGSAVHTDIMKTQSLKQVLTELKFDAAFGGARRDEEKSRAKERIFSFRTATHRWDPKNQRPELWNLYNTAVSKGESIRVFPISNWTELDVWQYIHREQIPIVPLYFAAVRPVIERDGILTLLDDDRLQPKQGEEIQFRKVRFRTLGCYPLTGSFESDADDVESIIVELLQAHGSERQGRAIDNDSTASMEKKKQEGYF